MPFDRLCRILGLIGLLAIAVLSTVPGSLRPHTGMPGKVEHFAAYFLTASVLAAGYPNLRGRLQICIGMSLCSGLFEILQIWIPDRSAQFSDALASSSGAISGVLVASAFLQTVLARSPTA